jgi:hypothetical protein
VSLIIKLYIDTSETVCIIAIGASRPDSPSGFFLFKENRRKTRIEWLNAVLTLAFVLQYVAVVLLVQARYAFHLAF